MSDEVLRLRGVEVRRDASVLLRNVDWTAHGDERWILIGPNGAGKTTLLQVAATLMFPTEGTVDVLGERLGEVDIFDLRPRIGLTSAAIAEQVPPGEKVIDLVLTASTPSSAGGRRNTTPPTSPGPSRSSTRSAART